MSEAVAAIAGEAANPDEVRRFQTRVYLRYGQMRVEQGRVADAAAAFRRVLELDPHSTDALRELGDLAAAAGRHGEAAAHYRRGLDIEASNETLKQRLAEASAAVAGDAATEEAEPEGDDGAATASAALSSPGGAPRHGAVEERDAGPGRSRDTLLALSLADLLVATLEYRDPYFRGASGLTRMLAVEIGRVLGLPDRRLTELALASLLRDTGRLAAGEKLFPQSQALLSPEGRRRVRSHVSLGLRLLEDVPLPANVRRGIRHHHERWDGRGYPDGLREGRIPLYARIIAVADAFAAMLRPRQHRLPRRIEDAMGELRQGSGRQFDPAVVAAALDLISTHDLRYFGLGRSQHILLVHPDTAWTTVLATRLCAVGYLAEVSRDFAVARQRMRQVPVDAVLFSARFPEAAGLGFVREVRADPHRATLPLLVLDADDPRRAMTLVAAGADGFFHRQVRFAQIRSALGALLGRAVRDDVAATKPDPLQALRGDLQDFALGWLLQMFGYHKGTAAIAVSGPVGRGVVYIADGDPHHAEAEGLDGEAALARMLAWKEGAFAVYLDRRPPRRTIHRSLMNVLLDRAVAADHEAWPTYGAVGPD